MEIFFLSNASLVLVPACGWKTCLQKSPISLHLSLCLLSILVIQSNLIGAGIISRRHLMAIGQVLYYRTDQGSIVMCLSLLDSVQKTLHIARRTICVYI